MSAAAATEPSPWLNTPLGGVAAAVMVAFWYGAMVQLFVPLEPRAAGRVTALVVTIISLVASAVAWADVFNDSSPIAYWIRLGAAVGVALGGLGMLAARALARFADGVGGAPAIRPTGL